MPYPLRNPNTIYLGGGTEGPGGQGGFTPEHGIACFGTPTPGMLAEYYEDAGVTKVRAHSTLGGPARPVIIFLEQLNRNLGVDDNYIAGSLADTAVGPRPGSTWWMLLPVGQTIAKGALLESNGNGMLKILAAGTPLFRAMEGTGGATIAVTRIRVERIEG